MACVALQRQTCVGHAISYIRKQKTGIQIRHVQQTVPAVLCLLAVPGWERRVSLVFAHLVLFGVVAARASQHSAPCTVVGPYVSLWQMAVAWWHCVCSKCCILSRH